MQAIEPVIHIGIFMIISLSLSSDTSIGLFCCAVVRLTGTVLVAFSFTYVFSYSHTHLLSPIRMPLTPVCVEDSCILIFQIRFLVYLYKSTICLNFFIDQMPLYTRHFETDPGTFFVLCPLFWMMWAISWLQGSKSTAWCSLETSSGFSLLFSWNK